MLGKEQAYLFCNLEVILDVGEDCRFHKEPFRTLLLATYTESMEYEHILHRQNYAQCSFGVSSHLTRILL